MAVIKFINRKNKNIASLRVAVEYIKDKDKTANEQETNNQANSDLDHNVELANQLATPERSLSDRFDEEVSELEVTIDLFEEMLVLENMIDRDTSYGRVIDYITNPQKASFDQLVSGWNCTPETAYQEMLFVKKQFGKETGRQFVHFIQSFSPEENVTPQMAHEIAMRLMQYIRFENYQVVIATHTDRDHLHTHFVLNTVNLETGLKWQQSQKDLDQLKEYANQIYKEYGLNPVETKKKEQTISDGEYRSKQRGESWVHELRLAIDTALYTSNSQNSFISNMQRLGYQVNWSDTRKYVTFITAEGYKKRGETMDIKYSKEKMLEVLDYNRSFRDNRELQYDFNKIMLLHDFSKYKSHKNEKLQSLTNVFIASLKVSSSREAFIENMQKAGYTVNWTDARKHITVITPEGNRVRSHRIDERFTKDILFDLFTINRTILDSTKALKNFDLHDDETETMSMETSIISQSDIPEDFTSEREYIAKWSVEYKNARACLYGNDEVKQDFEKAYHLMLAEAKRGNVFAIYDVGRMYMDGLFVEGNKGLAQKWYKQALDAFLSLESKEHHNYIQYRIGKMYNLGHGTNQDYTIAANWFEQSADQNNMYAQYTLGRLYLDGINVPKDVEKAIGLLKASADQGNNFAQYVLGKTYLIGRDVKQDKELAIYWLSKSAKQENEYAITLLDRINEMIVNSRVDFVLSLLNFGSQIVGNQSHNKDYPLSRLEGQALKDKLAEQQLGRGGWNLGR